MINNQTELQRLIDGKRPQEGVVYLEHGDYHITPNHEYRCLQFASCATPYGVRVFVHEAPLLVGHYSVIQRVTFIPVGDFAALRMDHSSRALFEWNNIRSQKQYLREESISDPENADTLETEGAGIEMTDNSIGEDNWHLVMEHNNFQALRVGVDVQTPGASPVNDEVKGTARGFICWNDFDGCKTGVRGERLIRYSIFGNHIQLHHRGIELLGATSSWVKHNSFERGSKQQGAWDIFYDENVKYMETLSNACRKERVNPQVYSRQDGNRFREFVTRNIGRP